MLLVTIENINIKELCEKYKDKVQFLSVKDYSNKPNWIISFIEGIKKSNLQYDVTIISYHADVLSCLTALNIEFTILLPDNSAFTHLLNTNYKVVEMKDKTIEEYLKDKFDWIKEDIVEPVEENNELAIPTNKNKLTFEQLLDDNLEITEADVRELKATTNKLKVGMLLQAKASLNRVLKLSSMLDKLYDKLLERIDFSLDTTDTASLMYTTEYISKALADTNQFITSLINNDKIQNFFIIDNSTVINASDDRVDINSRERVRKAVEIVLDNLDYFQEGQFNKLKNPNVIEVVNEEGGSTNDTNA